MKVLYPSGSQPVVRGQSSAWWSASKGYFFILQRYMHKQTNFGYFSWHDYQWLSATETQKLWVVLKSQKVENLGCILCWDLEEVIISFHRLWSRGTQSFWSIKGLQYIIFSALKDQRQNYELKLGELNIKNLIFRTLISLFIAWGLIMLVK